MRLKKKRKTTRPNLLRTRFGVISSKANLVHTDDKVIQDKGKSISE